MTKKRLRIETGVQLLSTDTPLTREGELSTSSSDKELKAYLDGATRTVVTENQAQELTNKTINADSNTISELEVDNLKSGVLNTSSVLAGASDTQVPSAKATKDYSDSQTGQVQTNLTNHINNTTGAHAASAISVVPTGTIEAVNVQTAIAELNSDSEANKTAIQNHINDTDDAHDASAISVAPISGVTGDDVQEVLESLKSQINSGSGTATWGGINGTLSNQTDLQSALNTKVNLTGVQTVSDKTLTSASIQDPTRLDFKKDTKANLTTYAATAANGQAVFATDEKRAYQVIDGALEPIGGGGTTFDQVQVAHGFSVLTPIYHNGTIWKKAQANSNDTLGMYVVIDASTDSFTAMKFGVVEIPSHGLNVGQYYYVSADTLGGLTDIEPIYGFSNPVLYIQDSTTIHIMAYRPSAIGDGTISDSEIGAVVAFPMTTTPRGFLPCDGREVDRTTYASLFNVLGTSHGYGSPQAEEFVFNTQASALGLNNVIFAQNKFVAIGNDSGVPNKIYTSTDGLNWTLTYTNPTFSPYSAIAFNGTRFVVMGTTSLSATTIAYSSDLINWTSATVPAASTSRSFGGLSANSAGLFVAVASNGAALGQVITSPDGITWTARTSSSAIAWSAIATNNSIWVATATGLTSNFIMSSPDGITWTTRTAAGVNQINWRSIAYGNGLFVAVSQGVGVGSTTTITSPDGITWTTRTGLSGTQGSWTRVIFAENKFIALGTNDLSHPSNIATSTDGIVWNFKGRVLNDELLYFTIAYGNGILVAARTAATTNQSIATSLNPNFNLPDYRGRFLRGLDGTAGNDPNKLTRTAMNFGGNTGNNVGSVQDDALQQMSGSFGIGSADGVQMARAYGGVFQQIANGANTPAAQYDGNPTWSTQIEFNASLIARTSLETRPKNAYINFFIRYEARGAIQGSELPIGNDGQILELVDGEHTWVDRSKYEALLALDVDFNSQVHYKELTTNATFTFSNIGDGKVVTLIIKNNDVSDITITIPTTINSAIDLLIPAGKYNKFTFTCANGLIFASSIAGMD